MPAGLFSSTAIFRLQPLFSLPTNLHFHSNTGALSKIRPSLSPPLGGRVQRNPSATRLFPVRFYFPSVFSRLFLRPGIDVPALCKGKAVPGAEVRRRTRTPADANTRGRNPRLPPGWAGERGLHRTRGGSARGGERGVPPVPPPALPGSRGGGGTGKPRGAPRERHLKGRTTAGEGGAVKGGGGNTEQPETRRRQRPPSKQTNTQTNQARHGRTGSGGGPGPSAGPPRLVRRPGSPAGQRRARGTR